MEVVYLVDKFEITENIVSVLKEKELYFEVETETVKVETTTEA